MVVEKTSPDSYRQEEDRVSACRPSVFLGQSAHRSRAPTGDPWSAQTCQADDFAASTMCRQIES